MKTPVNVYLSKNGNFAFTRTSEDDILYVRSCYVRGEERPELLPGIKNAIFYATGIPYSAICGESTEREVVFARMIYSAILWEHGFNLSRIGKSINRNHATIINLKRNLDTEIKCHKGLAEMYQNAKQRLCTQSAV